MTTIQDKKEIESNDENKDDIKELIVIGSGPHAFTLMLRLLEPDPDFQTDEERHTRANYRSKMRPISQVYRHIQNLSKGPTVTLKPKNNKVSTKGKKTSPPLSLQTVCDSTLVVDSHGGEWLSSWKQNFAALQIPNLRSLVNAHSDPYDHRTLQYYAERFVRRDNELVTLPLLTQRDKDFNGPYQVPSTKLFLDFHDLLAHAYGIEEMVQTGTVECITPLQDNHREDEAMFHVKIKKHEGSPTTIVKSKRIVCAMGPVFGKEEAFWEADLRKDLERSGTPYPSDRILHANEILSYIQNERRLHTANYHRKKRLLIIGGGITSAQLALYAAGSSSLSKVTFVQRSKGLVRHFDLENKWMGPRRGRLLSDFWSLDMKERARFLRKARQGGSIPPEILQQLSEQSTHHDLLRVYEEIQVSTVHWTGESLRVEFDDDGSSGIAKEFDMIWLSTGGETNISNYPALSRMLEVLPLEVVGGLPVLDASLSWSGPRLSCTDTSRSRVCGSNDDKKQDEASEESLWKQAARKQFYCLGSLAGLQLGPDALNLVGARHGAVRVAQAIRDDLKLQRNN